MLPNQEWEDLKGNLLTAPVKEPAATYVRVLGIELAAKLFETFGGAEAYFGKTSLYPDTTSGRIRECLGDERAEQLATAVQAVAGKRTVRVPTCSVFVARYLRSTGLKTSDIARRMGKSDTTILNYLKPDGIRTALALRLRRKKALDAIAELDLCPDCLARLKGHAPTHANDEKRQPANDRPKGRVIMRLPKAG